MPEETGDRRSQFRKSVVASVVASLLMLILIQPIMAILWRWVSHCGLAVHRGFVDAIYQSAALGHRNDVDVFFLGVLASGVIGVSVGTLAGVIRRLYGTAKDRPRPSRRRILVRLICLAVPLVVGILIPLTLTFADLQLNTSFQQRLTVLQSKISDQEAKDLRAAWASMEGKTDYDAIVARMEALAATHAVRLPKLLLK